MGAMTARQATLLQNAGDVLANLVRDHPVVPPYTSLLNLADRVLDWQQAGEDPIPERVALLTATGIGLGRVRPTGVPDIGQKLAQWNLDGLVWDDAINSMLRMWDEPRQFPPAVVALAEQLAGAGSAVAVGIVVSQKRPESYRGPGWYDRLSEDVQNLKSEPATVRRTAGWMASDWNPDVEALRLSVLDCAK